MKLAIALSLLAAACSGGGATVSEGQAAPADKPSVARTATPGEQPPSDQPQPLTTPDAGSDSSVPDAAVEPAVDAGTDAAADVVVPPPPPPPPPPVARYGVSFDGANNQRIYADLPDDLAGQAAVTFEGYFNIRAASSEGLLFSVASAGYCARVTTGPAVGKVACCTAQANGQCAYTVAAVGLNTFFHLAWVLSGGTSTLYLNGALQSTANAGYATVPAYQTFMAPNPMGRLVFGTMDITASALVTVDEFRLSYTKRYDADFAPSAHLDADGTTKSAWLVDEGAGASSGTFNLYGGASWVNVAR